MRACIVIQLVSLTSAALAFPTSEFSVASVHRGQSDAYPQARVHGSTLDTRTRAICFLKTRPVERRQTTHTSQKNPAYSLHSARQLQKRSHKDELQQFEQSFMSDIELTPNLINKSKTQNIISFPLTRQYEHELNRQSNSAAARSGRSTDRLQSNHVLDLLDKRSLSQIPVLHREMISKRRDPSITPGTPLAKRMTSSSQGAHTNRRRLAKSLAPKRTTSPGQSVCTTPMGQVNRLAPIGNIRTRRYSCRGTKGEDSTRTSGEDSEIRNIEKEARSKGKAANINTNLVLLGTVAALSPQFFPVSTDAKAAIAVCGIGLACQQWYTSAMNTKQSTKNTIETGRENVKLRKDLQDTRIKADKDIRDARTKAAKDTDELRKYVDQKLETYGKQVQDIQGNQALWVDFARKNFEEESKKKSDKDQQDKKES